jgi:hypothetical protein
MSSEPIWGIIGSIFAFMVVAIIFPFLPDWGIWRTIICVGIGLVIVGGTIYLSIHMFNGGNSGK